MTIKSLTVLLGVDMTAFEAGFKKAQATLEDAGTKMQDIGKKMAIAGAAVTATLSAIVIKTAATGDEFNELSQKTGVSSEVLSSLSLAASKSGTSIEALGNGMRFLSDQMIQTAGSSIKNNTILGAMNIAVKDMTTGALRPMNDVLFDVADRFAMMQDGAVKIKLAVALFGRSAMEMIPFLNLGRKGLEENAEAARKLGIVWSTEASRAADVFIDSLKDLKAGIEGAGKIIGEAMMPKVKGMILSLQDSVTIARDFANANKGLTGTVGTLALGLGGVLTISAGLVVGLGTLARSFAALGTAATLAAGAIGILTAGVGFFVYAFVKMQEATRNVITEQAELTKEESVLIGYLADAAVKCGIKGKAFEDLTAKYHGNIGAMAEAILAGNEEKISAEALNRVMTEARYAAEKKKMVTEAATNADSAATEMINALLAALDKENKMHIRLGETSLTLARNMDVLLDTMVKERIGETIIYSTNRMRDMSLIFDIATKGMEAAIANFAGKFGLSAGEVILWITNIQSALLNLAGIRLPAVNLMPDPAIKISWDGVISSIATGWIDTFETIMSKTVSAVNFLKGVWQSLTLTFKTAMNEMLSIIMATVIKTLAAKELEATASAIASVFASIPFPLNVILAAGVVGTVAALFGALHLKEGGFVKETGLAVVHKGETYIPPARADRLPPAISGDQRVFHFHNDIFVGGRKLDEQITKIVMEADALGNLRLRKAYR